jgi:hypothetical protein
MRFWCALKTRLAELERKARRREWGLVTEHRVWHLGPLRHAVPASLGTKVGTCWAGWLAAESI